MSRVTVSNTFHGTETSFFAPRNLTPVQAWEQLQDGANLYLQTRSDEYLAARRKYLRICNTLCASPGCVCIPRHIEVSDCGKKLRAQGRL